MRGEQIFLGKGQCAGCHPAPFYLDNQMHDLHLERFLKDEPGDGPIKTFTLRGMKDSPPYMHDGRCLTLEDTVEFFNVVLQTRFDFAREEGSGRIHAATLIIRVKDNVGPKTLVGGLRAVCERCRRPVTASAI